MICRFKRGAGGKTPIATIVVSGNGTYNYPIRAGEDQQVQTFLTEAVFPPLAAAPAIAAKGARAKLPAAAKSAAIGPPPAVRPFDPADASLYGQFVQAAYTMYSQNLLSPPR